MPSCPNHDPARGLPRLARVVLASMLVTTELCVLHAQAAPGPSQPGQGLLPPVTVAVPPAGGAVATEAGPDAGMSAAKVLGRWWTSAAPRPEGRPSRPCVFLTPEAVRQARNRLDERAWGWVRPWFEEVCRTADAWVARDTTDILSLLPPGDACFAYGVSGCPICGADWGGVGTGKRCRLDRPRQVTCANGHVLPDAEHPDAGAGYEAPDGRVYYLAGVYHSWVVEALQHQALANLVLAYTLTGEERYAETAAFILDCLSDLYPICDRGAEDYPGSPKTGRLSRSGPEVAAALVTFADWYDQLASSPAMARPSLRAGLTRGQNVETNLLLNGGHYCYERSLRGDLEVCVTDYLAGCLAVGSCLGVQLYAEWATGGPYGMLNQVRNSVDPNGLLPSAATGQAARTRELLLVFADVLRNLGLPPYPHGVDLYGNSQFQRLFTLPHLALDCAGHAARLGQAAPDLAWVEPQFSWVSEADRRFAERLYAQVPDAGQQAYYESVLQLLSAGDVQQVRPRLPDLPWLLFHGADAPEVRDGMVLEPALERRCRRSEFFGTRGIAILRSDGRQRGQAALIRYGPALVHDHLDDLNLNYYALGHELTYDLGCDRESTQTQAGWARQTASHNLVLVNEVSQGHEGSGSGGSLHLFAELPGLQVAEASAANAYAVQGVSVYRRLVALVGSGPDSCLVDIFRVVGGQRHDYIFHALGERLDLTGVELSAPDVGSVAGADIGWGALQAGDGNLRGETEDPSWNPPPRNGLGFLMHPQRGTCAGPWSATWALPVPDAVLRLSMLVPPGAQVVKAWAPGITPQLPRSWYILCRRQSDSDVQDLASTFLTVIEPCAVPRIDELRQGAAAIHAATLRADAEVQLREDVDLVLLKGRAKGDGLRWPLDLSPGGQYRVLLEHYLSPDYGRAQLFIDGSEVGETIRGTAEEMVMARPTDLGVVPLTAGQHEVILRVVDDNGKGRFWFGTRSLRLVREAQTPLAEVTALADSVTEVICDDRVGPVLPTGIAVFRRRHRTTDLFLSAGEAEVPRRFEYGGGEVLLEGRFAHLRLRAGQLVEVSLVGCRHLAGFGLDITCDDSAYVGTLSRVDEQLAAVEVQARLPADGRLCGQPILFTHANGNRNLAQRIADVVALPRTSRILLQSPTLTLGFGTVADVTPGDTEFTSLELLEYARRPCLDAFSFFRGRSVCGRDFSTEITSVRFGQPMRYQVKSTRGIRKGDGFRLSAVREGDPFEILTQVHLTRSGDRWSSRPATTDVTITVGTGEPFTLRCLPEPETGYIPRR